MDMRSHGDLEKLVAAFVARHTALDSILYLARESVRTERTEDGEALETAMDDMRQAHDRALEQMKASGGGKADVLCELLRALGYDDVVDAYDKSEAGKHGIKRP